MFNAKGKSERSSNLMMSKARNSSYQSKLKNAISLVKGCIEDNNQFEALRYFNKLIKILDIATSKKVCHKNKAARIKSKLFATIAGI